MKKHILITGSTDGIGKLTALKLAHDGHHVYLHGRNPKKLETTINEIKKGADTKLVDGMVADFSNLESVHQMADQIAMELPQLDVLINNAGVFNSNETLSKEQLDLRLTVNYLAPYLLTKALIPSLKQSQRPRIVNLSSAAQSPVSLDALQGLKSLSVQEGYAQSKLALTMWSFELAQKVKEIAVIAVNPGSLLNTKMANEAYGQHWSPANKGANILYDLTVSEEFAGVTGAYFDNDKGNPRGMLSKAHPDAYDPVKIKALINTTNTLLKDLGY